MSISIKNIGPQGIQGMTGPMGMRGEPGISKEEKDIMWDILVSDKPREVLKYIVELMKSDDENNIIMAKEALKS